VHCARHCGQAQIILLDEPCSELDPISTAKIEELIDELKKDYTVAIRDSQSAAAARVSDYTGYMYLGDLVEFGDTDQDFRQAGAQRNRDYITAVLADTRPVWRARKEQQCRLAIIQ
jgi:phosphate transport system ATP-binding protein